MITVQDVNQRPSYGAPGVMILVVLGYSMAPLIISLSGGEQSPFFINFFWRVGLALGYLCYLVVWCRTMILDPNFWMVVVGRIRKLRRPSNWRDISHLAFILAIVGNFDSALFALSTKFADVAIIAVLFETWPIFYILITSRIIPPIQEDSTERRSTNWFTTAFLIAVGSVGLIFIFASQDGSNDLVAFAKSLPLNKIGVVAVVVSLSAALLGSFPVFSFRWGLDLSREIASLPSAPRHIFHTRLGCITVTTMIANLISLPISAGIGFATGEQLPYHATFHHYVIYMILLGGSIGYAVPTILWRVANLMTDNPGVNLIAFLIPVVSVIWLVIFQQSDLNHWDYFVIGTAAIITANLLINYEVEVSWGFKSLVLGLGTFGAVVYLRDDVFMSLALQPWRWPLAGGGYFEALALSATIFTLLLAFRVARLVTRTRDEDYRAITLFRRVELLSSRGVINSEILQLIINIDTVQGRALRESYIPARRHIANAIRRASRFDRDTLSIASAELDALVHSRQQTINFGELASLIIFGGITIVLSLFAGPDLPGLAGFLIECFSMLFPAVILFLVFSVWDLQRERSSQILEANPEYSGYGVRFHDVSNRSFEILIAASVGFAITAAYVVLLTHKWFDWLT